MGSFPSTWAGPLYGKDHALENARKGLLGTGGVTGLAMFQEFTWNPIQLKAIDLIVEGETRTNTCNSEYASNDFRAEKSSAGECLHFV